MTTSSNLFPAAATRSSSDASSTPSPAKVAMTSHLHAVQQTRTVSLRSLEAAKRPSPITTGPFPFRTGGPEVFPSHPPVVAHTHSSSSSSTSLGIHSASVAHTPPVPHRMPGPISRAVVHIAPPLATQGGDGQERILFPAAKKRT